MKILKNLLEIIKKRRMRSPAPFGTDISRNTEPVVNACIGSSTAVREVQMTWVSKNDEDIKDYYFDSDNSSLFTIELD
jgi:hypothetical protein